MNPSKEKREPEYPAELESQFVLRLPEKPATTLREILQTGDSLKNRLTIQIDNDMRHGEVRLDHWIMHSKIFDLPTIIESLKTIDNKSFYKTADLCQMMICKEDPDQPAIEEEAPAKNKKKDPYKVDKKFLWPHGITPPTKNVRKRRFRKTLKKKCVEAPEIEKEVKRLLRADNEAISVTWEIIQEEDEQLTKPEQNIPVKPKPKKEEKKKKAQRNAKRGSAAKDTVTKEPVAKELVTKEFEQTEPVASASKPQSSNVVDIFGGAVSDSDLEEDNINVETEESRHSAYDSRLSETSPKHSLGDMTAKREPLPTEFDSRMFRGRKKSVSHTVTSATSGHSKSGGLSSEDDVDYQSHDTSKENMTFRIEQVGAELEELKLRRQRTRHEIAGMENLALRQRFQDILHTLNQDVMFKEMEYQGLITLQNSEDI